MLEISAAGDQHGWRSALLEISAAGDQRSWRSALLEISAAGDQRCWRSALLEISTAQLFYPVSASGLEAPLKEKLSVFPGTRGHPELSVSPSPLRLNPIPGDERQLRCIDPNATAEPY